MSNFDDPGLVAERNLKIRLHLREKPPWWRPFALRRWRRTLDALHAMDVHQWTALLRELYPLSLRDELRNRPNPTFAMLRKEKP